jgi:hypothetical protein
VLTLARALALTIPTSPLAALPTHPPPRRTGTLHSLEDRAKAARDSVADTAQRWRQEVEPRSEGEAKLAHGDIPYSTAELLGIHAQEKAKGGAAQEEQDPRPKVSAAARPCSPPRRGAASGASAAQRPARVRWPRRTR